METSKHPNGSELKKTGEDVQKNASQQKVDLKLKVQRLQEQLKILENKITSLKSQQLHITRKILKVKKHQKFLSESAIIENDFLENTLLLKEALRCFESHWS